MKENPLPPTNGWVGGAVAAPAPHPGGIKVSVDGLRQSRRASVAGTDGDVWGQTGG